MVRKLAGVVIGCLGLQAFAVTYTTANWQSDGSGYSGLFTNPDHWSGGLVPGGGWPASEAAINQIATFPRVDGDYTVTFPSGETVNASSFEARVEPGHKVIFDGLDAKLSKPTLSGASVYGVFTFRAPALDGAGAAKDGPAILRRASNANSATALGTFSGFKATFSSRSPDWSGTLLDLTGDIDWTGGNLCTFSDTTGSSTLTEADGRVKIRIHDANVNFNTFALQSNVLAPTNVLEFSNVRMRYNGTTNFQPANGAVADGEDALWELRITDGSVITNTAATSGALQLGHQNTAASCPRLSTNKTFRVRVDGGSYFKTGQLLDYRACNSEWLFTGPGTKVEATHTTANQTFASLAGTTSHVFIADGAYLQNRCKMTFGGSTPELAATSYGELLVSNAALRVDMDLVVNSGRIILLDGADLEIANANSTGKFCGGGVAGATAEIVADGGTARVSAKNKAPFLSGFTAARLGPKGLTVALDIASAFDLAQAFADLDEEGGVLTVKSYHVNNSKASFTLTSPDSDESYLAIAKGEVKLGAGANHYSHVVVTNGATYSLVGGATGMRIRGLTLGDAETEGTLALDADEVVTVEGPLNLVNPVLTFSSKLGRGTHTVFRKTVAPTSAEILYWELQAKSKVASGLDTTLYNTFQVEEDGGAWLFEIVTASELPVITGEAVWTGPGAAWKTAANWMGSTPPNGNLIAKFTGSEPKEVTVEGTAEAGAVEFSADGYVVSGGTVRLSNNSAAGFTATAGESEVASSVKLSGRVAADVAADAELKISGPIVGGGLAKTGTGVLELTSTDNCMPEALSLAGGFLRLPTPSALGFSDSGIASLLASGTLEFTGAGSTASPLELAGPVVFDAEADVTLPPPASSSAASAILKRGAARLTFETATDVSMRVAPKPTSADYVYTAGDSYDYPADGSALGKYTGLTVSEGEVVFCGTGPTVPRVGFFTDDFRPKENGNIALGVPGAGHSGEKGIDPSLVVDHCILNIGTAYLGFALDGQNSFVSNVYVSVTNGARLVGAITLPTKECGGTLESVRIFADRGAINGVSFNSSLASMVKDIDCTLVNGSKFITSRCAIKGGFRMSVTNSWMVNTSDVIDWDVSDREKWQPLVLQFYNLANVEVVDMTFSGGSVFGCNSVAHTNLKGYESHPVTLTFDGSEWWAGRETEVTLATSNLNVRTVSTGGGLIQRPESGQTWRWITPLEGDGGFVKQGDGAVVFACQRKAHQACEDPVTLACRGLIDVQSGVLAIEPTAAAESLSFRVAGTLDAAGGTLTGPAVASAGGILRNGVFLTPTFGFAIAADGTAPAPLVFDYAAGFEVSGRVVFDFGRTAADEPLASGTVYTIARWTGAVKPDVSKWRAVNLGEGRRCRIEAHDDGTVTATMTDAPGLVIMVR